jgi:hypothetical protein
MAPDPENVFVGRYVDIPCPSGKHTQSLITVAAMFCIPCEHAWLEGRDSPSPIHRETTTCELIGQCRETRAFSEGVRGDSERGRLQRATAIRLQR